jgi:integrase
MAHILEPARILRLLQAAKDESENHWLPILVAFIHALRAGEVVAITGDNIVDGKLVLKREKNSNPVNDDLHYDANPLLDERTALLELARYRAGNQKLFSISTRTFQRWVKNAGVRAGLPAEHCHPHMLKHSILDYLRESMPLEELQDRSGHKSLDSLRIYLHPKKSVVDAKVRTALTSLAM